MAPSARSSLQLLHPLATALPFCCCCCCSCWLLELMPPLLRTVHLPANLCVASPSVRMHSSFAPTHMLLSTDSDRRPLWPAYCPCGAVKGSALVTGTPSACRLVQTAAVTGPRAANRRGVKNQKRASNTRGQPTGQSEGEPGWRLASWLAPARPARPAVPAVCPGPCPGPSWAPGTSPLERGCRQGQRAAQRGRGVKPERGAAHRL